jgi:hypothetical protein
MACGRAVIAGDATGHADVITETNSFRLTENAPIIVNNTHGEPAGIWHEANIDEIIDQLEYAYQHRDLCTSKGHTAADNMKNLAWDRAARQFYFIGNKLRENARYQSAPIT